MKLVVITALLLAHTLAAAEPQGQLLVGAAIPVGGDDRRDTTLDLAGKGLWHFDVGAVGVAAHWSPILPAGADGLIDDHRLRFLVEGQMTVSADGSLAWILTSGVGVQLIHASQGVPGEQGGDWRADAVMEAGVCMAFTGWRFPPLLCLAVNVGLTTGDVDAVPLLGLRF